jgi:hypothetical protein
MAFMDSLILTSQDWREFIEALDITYALNNN